MEFTDFYAGKNDSERRIDKILRVFIPSASLSEIYKYLRKGLIKVNDKKIKQDYKVLENDKISVASFILNNSNNQSSAPKLKKTSVSLPPVVFENQHIIILDKPYDILVHGDENSLDKAVVKYYKSKNQDTSLSFTPGPLHRIDKKTTGLITFSMSLEGARWFSEGIKNHTIQKKYFAVLEGTLTKKEIWIDKILKDGTKDKNFYTVKTLSNDSEEGKSAYTEITPLKNGKYNNLSFTLAEINIKTGRTHQIRAQASLHKHPLLGDTAYNGHKLTEFKQDFFLQAKELIIPENPIGLPESIKIDYSAELKKFIENSILLDN